MAVIDGGLGDTLLRFLADRNISHVDTVIVSHADADHFGGISLLLSSSDFDVGRVFLNPDARDTALWGDFVSVMTDAKGRGTTFNLELTDVNPGHLPLGKGRLEVLAPSQELAVKTCERSNSGWPAADAKRHVRNRASVVRRFTATPHYGRH